MADDKRALNILNYANGAGFYENLVVNADQTISRVNLTMNDTTKFEFHQPSSAPMKSETHSGADVGIFAIGNESIHFP